ncbi:cohesin domain-containing protein [Candidatus Parcubacteria bacterium]|nr:cohesin domain-containing protein [Candidatus Parcubacteria bacterium]
MYDASLMERGLFKIALVCTILLGGFSTCLAASIQLSPTSGIFAIGKTFSVTISVSSSDQAMNATDGVLKFSKDKLDVVSLSKGGSIISLWVKEPSYSESSGEVHFEGVIPNPGFTGVAGRILTVTFLTKAVGSAGLNFSEASVLANDGKGTNILDSVGSALYSITASQEPTKPVEVTPVEEELPPVVQEVVKVGKITNTFLTAMIQSIALFIFLLFLIWYVWHKFKHLKRHLRREIHGAETIIYKSFKNLGDELEDYLRLRTNRKPSEEEATIINRLRKNLADTEQTFKTEVKEIDEDLK